MKARRLGNLEVEKLASQEPGELRS